MQVIEFDHSDDFLLRGAAVLVRNEAFAGLMYGVADRVKQITPGKPMDQLPFLAAVEDADRVALLAVMTPPHRVILHGADDEPDADALQLLVQNMRDMGRVTPGALGPRPFPQAFADLWTQASGQVVSQGLAMTVYELRTLQPPDATPGRYRQATEADRVLLETWTEAFFREVHGREPSLDELRGVAGRLPNGDYRIWEVDGQPVSYAAQSRPTPTGMAINAVYTPASLRGRGYATACVAALCAEILDSGKQFCTLFADVDNPTANGIYQRLGFEPLGEFVELDFT